MLRTRENYRLGVAGADFWGDLFRGDSLQGLSRRYSPYGHGAFCMGECDSRGRNILFSLTILTSMDFRIVELSVILCAGTISLQTNLLLC